MPHAGTAEPRGVHRQRRWLTRDSYLEKIPRTEKLTIISTITQSLKDRRKNGPAEPGLDAYIPELEDIKTRLDTHISGTSTTKGDHAALLTAADERDDDVDTWMRHIENYLGVEARRRTGPNRARAGEVYQAAFPDGLAHVDDRVIEENNHCRETIRVLRAPANLETLSAIGLPPAWVDAFEAAVLKSDAATDALNKGRKTRSTHIAQAQDVEDDWEDAVMRLRHHIAGRARRNELAKKVEGETILAPLASAIKKLHADAAARATRRAHEQQASPPTPPSNAPAAPKNAPTPPAGA